MHEPLTVSVRIYSSRVHTYPEAKLALKILVEAVRNVMAHSDAWEGK